MDNANDTRRGDFGIFNDEGLVEGGFRSDAEAQASLVSDYPEDDDCVVAAICHDHPEQRADACEECDCDD